MRSFAKRYAFFAAAERVRQAAAAQDDVLTDSYLTPDIWSELLPIQIASRARLSSLVGILFLAGLCVLPAVYVVRGMQNTPSWMLGQEQLNENDAEVADESAFPRFTHTR
ncbi:MAG: hypothetical protein H0U76_09080 [Ktedonobacteraceae bacterium]|nr:hypothetical protein [Ktedonobacteraceae bacterium]